MAVEVLQNNNVHLMVPELSGELNKVIQSEWFDVDYWKSKKAITGKSVGRNVVWFVKYREQGWVLRHYYRGGFIAKLIHDHYLYSGLKETRAYREICLLEQMYLQGLPTPRPIAACVMKRGVFYSNDILIEKIPNAVDLVDKLQKTELSEVDWSSIGSLIAKFHHAGIFHSDLNAHNILMDDQHSFWLIDFDKCRNRRPDKKWHKSNLERLNRSFLKEKNKYKIFYFDSIQWHWLIQGYERFSHQQLSKA